MPPKPGAKEKRRLAKLQEMQLKESAAQCDEGEEILNKVREDKPLSQNMQHYQGAVKCFTHAIGNNPENQRAYVVRGKCHKAMLEWDKAIADFTKAIELLRGSDTPGHQQVLLPDALNGRAYSLEQQNKLDEAIDDYTAVIELQPDDDHAYNMRGNARSRRRTRGLRLRNVEFSQVIMDFTRAIELNEFSFHAWANRGSAYFDHQEYRKAVDDYSRAMYVKDDYHYMLLRRAVAYYELVLAERQEDQDKAAAKAAGKLDSQETKTQEQLWEEEFWEEEKAARRVEQQDDFLHQALKDLDNYIKFTGGESGQPDVEAVVQRGLVQRLMGDLDAARASFKKAKEQAPELGALVDGQLRQIRQAREEADRQSKRHAAH
eukprot:TRINITY_DN30476_c0_g1_i1.p1 TRINITY_DN30476_c0_g1~~TRINITY_DN30476_c0_g1_i1.p1  ORF type:complete len:375 (+),score=132.64 TRINITY_DN30476_c0_g1_i1:79-1203(+)